MKLPEQIIHECNQLAIRFYKAAGYEVPSTYKMYEATHPQEVGYWNLAVIAYEHIEGTDIDEVLDECGL